jgi:hypothetical protein
VKKAVLFALYILIFSLSAWGAQEGKPSKKEAIRDTIVVHGMVLHGKVVGLGPEKLAFKLNYAEGINYIRYEDIDTIRTRYNYHISYNRIDIEGRVTGIKEHRYLLVKDSEGNERTVAIDEIDQFVMSVRDDDSLENRIRNRFRYISGTIGLGFEKDNGNSKKDKIDLLVDTQYKKAEHEVRFYADYAYEATETDGNPEVTNKDELSAFLTYKYHTRNDWFRYATLAAEYDKPRHIERQFVPSAGIGRRYRFGKGKWLEPSVGLGYATVDYTDTYRDKRFTAAAFHLFGRYHLEDVMLLRSLRINGFLLYYPSIEGGFAEDWIMRSNLTFTVPLLDFFSVKLAFDFINDSNPNPEVGNNKTTTKLLFGVDF